MATEALVLEDKRVRYIAIGIVVLVGIAYMGWLVITYMEQRETGMHIRRSLDEFLAEFRERTGATVTGEVLDEHV